MEVKEIEKLLKQKNIKQTQLAKELGLKVSAVNNWFARGSIPKKHLLKVYAVCGIEIESDENKNFVDNSKEPTDAIHNAAASLFEHGVSNMPPQSISSTPTTKQNRQILGSASNKRFSDSFESLDSILKDLDRDFCAFKVADLSMYPNLIKNDVVLFKNMSTLSSDVFGGDGLYVLKCNNTLCVRRVQYDILTHAFKLICDNPQFETYSIPQFTDTNCIIVGKVEYIFKQV
jgi:transcriptional regulator with XRE-family HTH domain